MSELKYRTRANTYPYAKDKVYFMCHPTDFEKCFEVISNKVLKIADCSIWYDGDDYACWDAISRYEDIKQMQVVMIAISEILLKENNTNIECELNYIKQNNIGIVPIVIEEINDTFKELYEKKFSNLQYLNLLQGTENDKAFELKLKSHLDKILTDDLLKARIKECFDAKIFISYRKKDRKFLEELMSRIHQKDEFEGVSFWHDEFLIPGEDYNETICDAIRECDFALLCVTPNVLEEGNYILEKEYSEIVDNAKKYIFPIEMYKTEGEQLKTKYPGMPFCVSIEDEVSLFHMLQNLMRGLGIVKKENTPERNYLFGLAYLNGINGEIDLQKAYMLIEKSAKVGYKEAIRKMEYLYRFGLGVEADINRSIYWREQYLDVLRKQVDFFDGITERDELYNELEQCGDFYESLYDEKNAFRIYKELKEYVESVLSKGEIDPEWKMREVICYRKLARFNSRNSHLEEAKNCCKKGISLAEQLLGLCSKSDRFAAAIYSESNFGGIYELNKELAELYQIKGNVASIKGDKEKMKKYYDRSCEIRKALDIMSDSPETKLENIKAYIAQAICAVEKNDLDTVKLNYGRCIEIYEEFYKETESIEYLVDKAQMLNKIADAHIHCGEYDDAIIYAEESLKVLKSVFECVETPMAYETKAYASIYIGQALFEKVIRKKADYDDALKRYKEGIEIYENNIDVEKSGEARYKLYRMYYGLGLYRNICQDEEGALDAMKKAMQFEEHFMDVADNYAKLL